MQLTKNFKLEEFTRSATAAKHDFIEQLDPPAPVVANLQSLCVHTLQPIRDLLPEGFIRISSGYRCQRLNSLVGGKPTSQHLKGQAADISWIVNGETKNERLFDLIVNGHIPFDQLINENNFAWVHISFNERGNRGQVLKL